MAPRNESAAPLGRTPVNSLDSVRPRALPATLRSQSQSTEFQPRSIAINLVVKDALQRHYGKLQTAAELMKMDAGQLSRELGNGAFKLETLERLDPEGQAFVAKALYEAFDESDPKVALRRLIQLIRRCCDELSEVIAS